MSYVERALSPGERIEARARLHWVLWLRAIAALLVLGWVVIGIYFFFRDLFFLVSTEVALTNRRLMYKTGLFERHASDLILGSIEVVEVEQDFWGKLLGYGRIRVHGTGSEEWVTPLIANPVSFRRDIAAVRPNGAMAAPANHAGS